jgi:hypothetical protein
MFTCYKLSYSVFSVSFIYLDLASPKTGHQLVYDLLSHCLSGLARQPILGIPLPQLRLQKRENHHGYPSSINFASNSGQGPRPPRHHPMLPRQQKQVSLRHPQANLRSLACLRNTVVPNHWTKHYLT